jgi:hypothetical protein
LIKMPAPVIVNQIVFCLHAFNIPYYQDNYNPFCYTKSAVKICKPRRTRRARREKNTPKKTFLSVKVCVSLWLKNRRRILVTQIVLTAGRRWGEERKHKTDGRGQKEKTLNQWISKSGKHGRTVAIVKVLSTTLGPRPGL